MQKQLPQNYLLKGLKTCNVKLDSTLDAMPPCEHLNGLPKTIYDTLKLPTSAKIDDLLTAGNFVITGNK